MSPSCDAHPLALEEACCSTCPGAESMECQSLSFLLTLIKWLIHRLSCIYLVKYFISELANTMSKVFVAEPLALHWRHPSTHIPQCHQKAGNIEIKDMKKGAVGRSRLKPMGRGKRPDLKVHINTTGDSVLLKFLRPNPNVKLEGFLLGYGSNVSPNQYFPLPADGKYTEAVVDAEPKYLIVVRPAPPPSQKKSCSGKSRPRKPLQLVVGTLTPSSVFLSWGFLINPHHDWTLPSHCPNDRYYTIRYREKDKEKKWVFQLCPATETIVENLKPNTVYEFGVKDNVEGGIWSKIFNHKTIVRSKNKVNGKIQSTYDQVHTVPAYVPRRIIPVTIIKQVIQNITHRASTKSTDRTPFGGTILLHLVIPGLNETTVKLPTSLIFEISDALKTQLATNETLALPAESKTPQVEKIPAQPITAPKRLPEFPQAKTPFPFEKPGGTLGNNSNLTSSEKLWIGPTSKTPEDTKVLPPRTATYDVSSSPATPDEHEIAEPRTAPSKTQFISLKPKIPFSPEVTHTKPATPKTKRPGRRPRPKATRRPDVPKSKPALEPATVQPELLVPTVASEPSKRPKTTRRPAVPQIQPDSIPPKQLLPKPKSTAKPDMPPTASAPKPPQRTRPRRPRPKHKTTPSPEAPQTKIDFKPVTPETSLAPKKTTKRPRRPRPKPKTTPRPEVPQTKLVPATIFEPVTLRTEAPGTTLAPKVPQRPRRPRPKPKTTPRPEAPQTELVLQPVTPIKEAPGTTFVPVTDHEPVTLRTETFGTTSATKTSQRPRRPRPRPKTTRRPQVPPSKPGKCGVPWFQVPATILEPVTVKPEALGTTLVLTTDLEPVTFRTETWATTQAPKTSKRTRRPRPKSKTTPTPEAPQTKSGKCGFLVKGMSSLESGVDPSGRNDRPCEVKPVVPTRDLEPGTLRTEAPEIVGMKMFRPTVLEPVTLRTKAPETTLAPTELQTLILEPVTSPSLEMTQSQPVVESITPVSEPPESTLAPKQIPRTPPKPKTPPRPRIPETQPAPKVSQRVTPRPKTFPSPEASYTLPVPKDVLLPHKPDPEVSESESVLQPVTFRIDPPETTIAPLETRGSPFIPMISPSPSQEELQMLAETDQSTQELVTTKIPRTTESAKTAQALVEPKYSKEAVHELPKTYSMNLLAESPTPFLHGTLVPVTTQIVHYSCEAQTTGQTTHQTW
ncbi:hypothetical protein MC885_012634 [Smutsia gigantea]|nr:hypothetical protein MC885_012634 [Smutsia gigantea]